jgi:hypothetical protein
VARKDFNGNVTRSPLFLSDFGCGDEAALESFSPRSLLLDPYAPPSPVNA